MIIRTDLKKFCEEFGIELEKKDCRGASSAPRNDNLAAVELTHEQIIEQMNRAWEKFPVLPAGMIMDLEKKRGWTKVWIEILDLRFETWRLSKKGELYQVKEPVKIAIPIRDVDGNLVNVSFVPARSKTIQNHIIC